jgi:hypothetical protein
MNFVDCLAFAFMGYGIWRGWRKGLGYELPGLIGVAVFAVSGFGAIRWTYVGLSTVSSYSPFFRIGFLAAPFIFFGAFLLVRHRLKQIQAWADQRFRGPRQKTYGAVAGLLRTAIIAGFLIVYLSLINVGFIHRTFGERCLIGRTLTTWVLPVYQTLFDKMEKNPEDGGLQNLEPGMKAEDADPDTTEESPESGRMKSKSSR